MVHATLGYSFYIGVQLGYSILLLSATLVHVFKFLSRLYHYSPHKLSHLLYEMHDFVPYVKFKSRKKHPWRSVTFSKVAACNISCFLNYTNDTKSRKASHIFSLISFCNRTVCRVHPLKRLQNHLGY